jgi:fatty-acyl-CoA synthase
MLTINTNKLSKPDADALFQSYRDLEHFRSLEGEKFAVCFTDPAYIVTMVLFLRRHACSILLIPGETPLQTAITMAVNAECSGLMYGEPKNYFPLGESGLVEEPASLYQYSSGTTGGAKLISRTWGQIDTEIAAYNQALDAEDLLAPVILAPVSHAYGLISGVMSALERGKNPTIITNKNPKFALRCLQETPQHLVYGVPMLFHAITGFIDQPMRFHTLMTSGISMSKALFSKLAAMTNVMKQQYGCSEAGCISLSNGMDANVDIGSPLRHVTICTPVKKQNPDEIVIAIEDKTIHTKDIGYWATRSHLHFVARADDVINVSGLKVFPLEVEETISRMEGIQEAVVYRGHHPVMGEIVKAMVVAEQRMTAERIRGWCAGSLPPYKTPYEILLVGSIPKNANGKISRRLLETGEGAL